MRLRRRIAATLGAVLTIIAISAGVTAGIATYFPALLPTGPRGAQGPAGAQGAVGETGSTGATGTKGAPGETAVSDIADDGPEAPPAAVNEAKHYYYGGEDLGTVAQHEQFCRSLRARQDGEGINDQDELEREGCRGGGRQTIRTLSGAA